MQDNLARKLSDDDVKEEMIHGKIFMMSPRPVVNHAFLSRRIDRIFDGFFDGKPCVPFSDNTDVHLTDDICVVPDAFVVCDSSKIRWNGVYGVPDLVVEILSPGTEKRDRTDKMQVYEESGVREYWLVSPSAKSVELYLSENGHFRLQDVYTYYPEWQLDALKPEDREKIPLSFHSRIFPELEISLRELFSNLLREADFE